MTRREVFKLWFLEHCAERGMTAAEIQEQIEKAASFMDKLTTGGGVALATAAAAPLALGAGTGYMLGKAQDSPIDDEDVKKQEEVNEYRRLASAARRRVQLRKLQARRTTVF